MPYMSPAAIGRKNVRPCGCPSRTNRSPIAASIRSGHASPDEELAATTAPSGIKRAASSKLTILLRVMRERQLGVASSSAFEAVHGQGLPPPPARGFRVAQQAGAIGEPERLGEMQDVPRALLSADHHEMLLMAVQPREEDDARLVEPGRRAEEVPRQGHRGREDLVEALPVAPRQRGERGGGGRRDGVEDAE